jgi:hypothetical protein
MRRENLSIAPYTPLFPLSDRIRSLQVGASLKADRQHPKRTGNTQSGRATLKADGQHALDQGSGAMEGDYESQAPVGCLRVGTTH